MELYESIYACHPRRVDWDFCKRMKPHFTEYIIDYVYLLSMPDNGTHVGTKKTEPIVTFEQSTEITQSTTTF